MLFLSERGISVLKGYKRNYHPYLFISPYFIIYLVFGFFPVIFSLFMSFMNWDGVSALTFVGFKNYIRLFTQDKSFYQCLYNTFIVIVIAIPLQLCLGLLLAVSVNDFFKSKKDKIQLANFLPYITTPVAIGLMFEILFDEKYGTINVILQQLGLVNTPIPWLNQPFTARLVVIILLVWKYYGYMMVMFTAGLVSIPEELYEAAKIDGAKWKDTFLRITIPLLKPTMTFLVTICIIGGFQLFDEPMMLFSRPPQPFGGPDRSMLTVIMNLYNTAFQRFDFGYGSTIAYGLFIIIFIFSIVTLKFMNRGSEE